MSDIDRIIGDMRKRARYFQYKNYFSWIIITSLFLSTVYYFVESGSGDISIVITGESLNSDVTVPDKNIFDFFKVWFCG